MSTKIGINGFGRIGRDYLRYVLAPNDLEVVAVNDVTDSATLARLLRYDSTFGPLHREVEDLGDAIAVDGRKIAVSAVRDPRGVMETTTKRFGLSEELEAARVELAAIYLALAELPGIALRFGREYSAADPVSMALGITEHLAGRLAAIQQEMEPESVSP
jgi:Glyceraldehyde 3-phosphate dehydrogenase, NAD binding domain